MASNITSPTKAHAILQGKLLSVYDPSMRQITEFNRSELVSAAFALLTSYIQRTSGI